MFDEFFNHTCDIYHKYDETVDAEYGISTGDTRSDKSEPDEADIKCHFYVSTSLTVVQKEPYADIEGMTKLALPYGTDIRINDTVVDKDTGTQYRATGVPRVVHGNHHIIVMLEHLEGEPNAI